MDRAERLQWCKDRALAYLPHDPAQAMTSFMSDASAAYDDQPCLIDWDKSAMLMLCQLAMMHAAQGNGFEMRRWIEGFN